MIRSRIPLITLAALGILLTSPVAWAGGKSEADAKKAVLKRVDSYVKAFNRGDAKAVAEHWSETGEYLTSDGEKVKGQAAIEKAMAEVFAKHKGVKLEVTVQSVRFLKPDIALEEGTATIFKFGEPPDKASYVALHVLEKGEWRLDSVRETDLPVANGADVLDDLDWLLGEWLSDSKGELSYTKGAWTANRAFLAVSFQVGDKDRVAVAGTQVIGWDAAKKQIRSWIFDSDGGISEGVWTKKDKSWHVQLKATMGDGRTGTATTIYTIVDNDRVSWQSINRQVDGELLPNVGPVELVRKK